MTNRLRSETTLEPNVLSAPTNSDSTHSASTHSVASAVCTESGEICRHALFAPLHYERNYAYPLFVWLHSPGGDETQLRRVMPELSMRNYVAVAPRGTSAIDDDADEPGYRWRQKSDDILLAEQRIFDCIELAVEKFRVAPERIFVAGAGCGGTMALRIALANPGRFAGAMSLGGELPRGMAPLAKINRARSLPLLVMAGLASERYPQPRVNDDLRLLHSAGIGVTLRLYPFGDEIAPPMLGDVDRWMMRQICPESAEETTDENVGENVDEE